MSKWHYQVFRYAEWDENGDNQGTCGYGIHEFYNLATGDTWTVEPVPIAAESVDELRAILQDMLRDLDEYGVLDYDDQEDV